MKSLTLAVRTLREDSRAPVQWVMRSALVATFLVIVVTQHGSRNTVGAAGRDLFEALVWTNFWFVLVVGSALFSSVITEEKEQGTLGLLQLAGFGAPAILFGRSIGELTSAALLLAVQLPFAILTVTLGGVSLHQVLAAFALLCAFTVEVYGLALLSSVVCQRTASAVRLTAGLVGGATFAAWLARLVLGWLGPSWASSNPAWVAVLDEVSPVSALASIAATGSQEPALNTAVIASLVVGAVAILLAARLFPRSTAAEAAVGPQGARWSRIVQGARGRPHPGAQAIAWKEFHVAGLGRTGVWLRLAAVAAILLVAWSRASPAFPAMSRFAAVCIHASLWMLCLFVLDAGSVAGRLFRGEIRWHTLAGLFALPISRRRWVAAKAWGGIRLIAPTFAGFMLTVLVIVAEFGPESVVVPQLLNLNALILVYVHLTAYLSLHLRRGAFALALGPCLASHFLVHAWLGSFFSRDSFYRLLYGLALFQVAASVALQFAILRRLRTLTARQD